MYEKIKKWYSQKLWTAAMVQNAVMKGKITQGQYDEIIGGKTI
ncbi:MAG: XkdX family protein [Oscillospiraceae bacterium]